PVRQARLGFSSVNKQILMTSGTQIIQRKCALHARTRMDTQVLIVGAGPVGLTLAIDLGKRGVRCTLIEKNAAPLGYPKMERCNPRTMEIFRRIGIAEEVRAAGYPADWPMDVYLIFD